MAHVLRQGICAHRSSMVRTRNLLMHQHVHRTQTYDAYGKLAVHATYEYIWNGWYIYIASNRDPHSARLTLKPRVMQSVFSHFSWLAFFSVLVSFHYYLRQAGNVFTFTTGRYTNVCLCCFLRIFAICKTMVLYYRSLDVSNIMQKSLVMSLTSILHIVSLTLWTKP